MVHRYNSPKARSLSRRVRDWGVGKEISRLLDLIQGNRTYSRKETSLRGSFSPSQYHRRAQAVPRQPTRSVERL